MIGIAVVKNGALSFYRNNVECDPQEYFDLRRAQIIEEIDRHSGSIRELKEEFRSLAKLEKATNKSK